MYNRRPIVVSLSLGIMMAMTCATFALAQQAPSLTPSAPASTPAAPPASRPSNDGRMDRIAEIIASAVDKKHGGVKFRAHSVFQCDLALTLGDVAYEGRLSFQVNGPSSKLEMTDGTTIVFDGTSCWVSGSAVADDVALARVLALRELVAAPFLRHERGVRIFGYRATMVAGGDADSYRIAWPSHDDSPAIECVAYADVRSQQLTAIGSDSLQRLLGLPESDHPARSIVFSDPVEVDGAYIPATWTFFEWKDVAGVFGSEQGKVKISNAGFARQGEVRFEPPAAGHKAAPHENN